MNVKLSGRSLAIALNYTCLEKQVQLRRVLVISFVSLSTVFYLVSI